VASLWRYLRVFARPVPMVGNIATVVQAVSLLVGVIGGAAVLGRTFAPAVGVVAALGVLLVLAVIAGVQIQREADRRGLWELVERELQCAWEEAQYALAHPATALRKPPGPLDDWHGRTVEYLRVALGPAAAAHFGSPVRGPGWDDMVQQYVDRLISLAGQLDESAVRASQRDLRDAAQARRANAMREQMSTAAMVATS
jgi:hypothetical protein